MNEHGIRGLDQGRIVDLYRLGVVIRPLPGDERFAGMLSIPYLTPNGVKAIKFRKLSGEGDKYAAPKNQSARLYNTQANFSSGQVIGLAEGEIDAIVATEFLGIPTMGVPGAEMWIGKRTVWKPLFKNFRQVLVFTDGDPPQERVRNGVKVWIRPGEELGDAICESLKTKARVIACPEGEDVSSMVAKGRAEELTRQFQETEDDDEDEEDVPPF